MPAIADQVASLENDLAAALKQIDRLTTNNEELTQSLAAMSTAKLALEAQAVDLKQHDEETRAAAEGLANAALDMLRISQRPPGMPAEVIKFAPKLTGPAPSASATALEQAVAAAIVDPPAPSAVVAGDSGDEQSTTQRPIAEPAALFATIPEPLAEPPLMGNDAMSRIQPTARVLPPISFVREPTGPMLVRDNGPLPMFLQRDTVFHRGDLTIG